MIVMEGVVHDFALAMTAAVAPAVARDAAPMTVPTIIGVETMNLFGLASVVPLSDISCCK